MARLKSGEIKKEQISFRLKPDTIDRLKSIDKYHSKVDKYINLGIDFEKLLELSREDILLNIRQFQERLMSLSKVGYGEIKHSDARFYFEKTDKYFEEMFSRYDDETVVLLRIFYLMAFTDDDMLNAITRR